VLVVTMALQVLAMVLLGDLPGSPQEALGLPGAIAVLLSVIAGALTGPLGGVAVAGVGSAAFIVFVSQGSTAWATVASVALWVLAALFAGLVSRVLRGQVRMREERLESRQRLEQGLNVIGTLLTSSLDSDEILDRAVRLAAEELPCDGTAIVLRQDDEWRPLVTWNMPAAVMGSSFRAAEAPFLERAFREGRPVQVVDDPGRPDDGSLIQAQWGLASSLIAPLTVRGVREGALVFSFLEERHEFSDVERMFAVRAASRLGQALENARLYERLSDVAVTLQASLARAVPEVEGLSVDLYRRVAYSPQLVGGDFADVFRTGDTVDVVIGDVEGKGVGASALAETVRSGVRAVASLKESPAFVLGHLNRVLIDEGTLQFVTVLLLRLDTRTNEITVASAGHPPPFSAGPRGARILEAVYGPPLGTFEYEYEEAVVSFLPDEVLLLYTDGLTEARGADGTLFGEDRVLRVLSDAAPESPQAATAALKRAVERFAPDLHDDMQLLAVSFAPGRRGESEEARAGSARAPSAVRSAGRLGRAHEPAHHADAVRHVAQVHAAQLPVHGVHLRDLDGGVGEAGAPQLV
jgi:serine phosphatase RsbU (regulator of sigma subunit)